MPSPELTFKALLLIRYWMTSRCSNLFVYLIKYDEEEVVLSSLKLKLLYVQYGILMLYFCNLEISKHYEIPSLLQ